MLLEVTGVRSGLRASLGASDGEAGEGPSEEVIWGEEWRTEGRASGGRGEAWQVQGASWWGLAHSGFAPEEAMVGERGGVIRSNAQFGKGHFAWRKGLDRSREEAGTPPRRLVQTGPRSWPCGLGTGRAEWVGWAAFGGRAGRAWGVGAGAWDREWRVSPGCSSIWVDGMCHLLLAWRKCWAWEQDFEGKCSLRVHEV